MNATLVELSSGKKISLPGKRVLIGRNKKNDVVCLDPQVSGYHCALSGKGGNFFLEDIKSSNGTFLNGERISESAKLKNNDEISLGKEHTYRFEIGSAIPFPLPRLFGSRRIFLIAAGGLLLAVIIGLLFLIVSRGKPVDVRRSLEHIESAYGRKIFPDHPDFQRQVEYWAVATREDGWFEDTLKKRRTYRELLESLLRDNKVPAQFSFIPWAESHYSPQARNRLTGAAGLWQLMPQTARHYGLRIGGGVDERYDPEKATQAAARYLKDLLSIFGDDDFLLILAAYNAGDGAILYSLKRIPDPVKDRNFWYLYQNNLIPEETKAYVLKIVACMVLEEEAPR